MIRGDLGIIFDNLGLFAGGPDEFKFPQSCM
jgi:hypothetical protein